MCLACARLPFWLAFAVRGAWAQLPPIFWQAFLVRDARAQLPPIFWQASLVRDARQLRPIFSRLGWLVIGEEWVRTGAS